MILVIGKTGQLAAALWSQLKSSAGIEMYGQSLFLGRDDLDLSDPVDIIQSKLNQIQSLKLVIVAAAYTNVEEAETDPVKAYVINSCGPEQIAKHCEKHNVGLVYVSTDYVFDGEATSPYLPVASTNPLNSYGRSKADGEAAILATEARVIILRTSWVYDGVRSNFFTKMLNSASKNTCLKVVSDQIGRPTYAPDLATACLQVCSYLLKTEEAISDIHHVTGGGDAVSWAGFAQSIFKNARLPIKVEPIKSSDYPSLAQRPKYAVLDMTSFEEKFQYTMPHWEDALISALAAYNP